MADPARPSSTAGGSLRSALRFLIKAGLTVGAFYLLLGHRVTDEAGQSRTTFEVIRAFLPEIGLGTFLRFVFLATGIKLIGILASMWRWSLLLRGQGIELPFRHVAGSFLIGRFLGTFLPSTIGLDGYKLYDAARFSGRSVEASGATLVEKVLGFAGIFLTYLVALPFGVSIFGERAGQIMALTLPVALLPLVVIFAIFGWPGPRLIDWAVARLPVGPYAGFLRRLAAAITAYGGHRVTLFAAGALSFVVHFTTAAMYFFTALAIGVTAEQASFWQVTFGSTIQIFATVLSPFTIAGEGIREMAQYYLLSHLMGPAEAIVSAALGFWAAEGLTLFGGIVWWVRRDDYTPAWCRVGGHQVDYVESARAARDFGLTGAVAAAEGGQPVEGFVARVLGGGLIGLGAGLLAGALLGLGEAALVVASAGAGEDVQILWYGPALYGLICAAIGAGAGAGFGLLPLPARVRDRWGAALAFVAGLLPLGLAVALFRVQRDVFLEQRPPLPVLGAVAFGGLIVALLLGCVVARVWRAPLDPAARLSGRVRRLAQGAGVWLCVVAVGAIGAAVLAPVVAPSPDVRAAIPAALRARPNVVLVIVDTLRGDHLGVYGDPRGLSPNIDAAASDGSTYEASGQSSWTKPSVATILTSLYASSHGAMSKPSLLPDVKTLADELTREGYTTAGFVSNINLAPSFNFQQGFGEYTYLPPDYLFGAAESSSKLVLYSIVRKVWFSLNKKRWVGQYYQDSRTVNGHLLPWLERHAEDRFFVLAHYMDPHDPYFAHPYDGEAIARVEMPNPPPELAPRMLELYAGEVKHMDESFGALVAKLRALGIYDDTLIVLTADHGEEFFEHGGWWHGTTLYDEQVGVPLVVKWPAGMVADSRPAGVARLLDVAPTILAATGTALPAEWQGVDLRRGIPAERTAFAEEDHEGNVLTAARRGRWKSIRANPGNPRGLPEVELFDLEVDPGEDKNLADAEAARVAELDVGIEEITKEAASEAVESAGEVKMDDATRDRLRALGYIE